MNLNPEIFIQCMLALISFHIFLHLQSAVQRRSSRRNYTTHPVPTQGPIILVPGQSMPQMIQYITLSWQPAEMQRQYLDWKEKNIVSAKIIINDEVKIPFQDWQKFLSDTFPQKLSI